LKLSIKAYFVALCTMVPLLGLQTALFCSVLGR
jgi:hypothetical protein